MLASSFAQAGTILYYDSNSGTALARIASQTDAAFVASSDATTSLGSNTTFYSEHGSQSHTVTLGTGNDLMFRFGGTTEVLSGTLANALTTGEWIV